MDSDEENMYGHRPPAQGGHRMFGRGNNTRGNNARGNNARGHNTRGPNARGPNARGPNARGYSARGQSVGGQNQRDHNPRDHNPRDHNPRDRNPRGSTNDLSRFIGNRSHNDSADNFQNHPGSRGNHSANRFETSYNNHPPAYGDGSLNHLANNLTTLQLRNHNAGSTTDVYRASTSARAQSHHSQHRSNDPNNMHRQMESGEHRMYERNPRFNDNSRSNYRNFPSNEGDSRDDRSLHNNRREPFPKNKRPPGLGFKKLQEFSELDPDKLLTTLNLESNNLKGFLCDDVKDDVIVLFVKCLKNLSTVQFDGAKSMLLIMISKSKFMDALQKYLMGLPYVKIPDKRRNWLFWNNIEDFFHNLIKFAEAVIDLSPSTAVDTFNILFDALKMSLQGLQNHQKETFSNELVEAFDDIQVKFAICIEEEEKKVLLPTKSRASDAGLAREVLPPDNFRDISIMPLKEDLFNKPDFLRPNIVDGAYNSVEHYLDVQFRLMREDFIAPLRDALREYNFSQSTGKKAKFGGARFYTNAKFLSFRLKNGVLAVEICYNEKLANKKKSEKKAFSKRFMYGSLLCLTCDDFASILFCTVHDRDDVDVGKVSVEVAGAPITDQMFGKTYLLIECETYFPPYLHVLKALQNPSLVANFPFERYIVKVEPTESTPKYLQDLTHYFLFNGTVVNLQDVNLRLPWSERIGLDKSQYTAYIMALMREFVTIQGPPGTGKTFIGLKIASTILNNCYLNSNQRSHFNPILVVCYTNHALDQFLEGLLKVTRKLVRIGGQSKNEVLQEFNLNNLRKFTKENSKLKNSLRDNSRNIEIFQALLKSLQSRDHIFDLENEQIRFNIPHRAPIVCKLNMPINLKTYLSKFADGKRPPLVNWLLLSDFRRNNKYKPRFTKVPSGSSAQQNQSDEDDEINEYFEDDDDDDDVHRPVMDIDFIHGCDINTDSFEYSIKDATRQFESIDVSAGPVERQLYEDFFQDLEILKAQLSRGNREYTKVRMFSPDVSPEVLIPEQRWSLYWEWLEVVIADVMEQYSQAIVTYQNEKINFEELTQALDLDNLKNTHVVGVTTSGAARLQSLLRSLRSPIVIVEEAAEVMESHVVVSLTKDCEHLIMIGDHQQLRPITATYQLAKKFKLDISLFERMVNNGSHCYRLDVQHRMRPEIARLITPAIYTNLKNNESVEKYPDVKGVVKSLFFIDHTVPESKVEDISSRLNDHEARFVLNLAKYFIQQGYAPDEITILATYSGQMFHFRKLKSSMSMLGNVRINVLDNFQGEENKIILLSLVRSNPEENIGFLATDNRVCVALSRAREGFFIIGNMGILMKKSPLWSSVNDTLTDLGSIGPNLMLSCQVHKNVFTPMQSAEDFGKVPEGGCTKLCGTLMACGHDCKSFCHPLDRLHEKIKCKEKCQRMLCILEHVCPLRCYEKCQSCRQIVTRVLPCGHKADLECHADYRVHRCKEILTVDLPLCQHKGKKFCYENLEDVKCPEPCEDRLACGHACRLLCHKKEDPDHLKYNCNMPCARLNKGCSNNHQCKKVCFLDCSLCSVPVKKLKKCSHTLVVDCCVDVETAECPNKCKRSLKCGHHCTKSCKDICDEKNCIVIVEKLRSCGHKVKAKCSQDPENILCTQKCLKKLPCGHPCHDLCYKPCRITGCKTLVPSPFASLCGHKFEIQCSKTSYGAEIGPVMTMLSCPHPCGTILKGCEHTCKGTCGKCAGGRLHIYCGEPCGVPLVCGHSCDQPCRDACPPCNRKCEVRCNHSKCPHRCGVPCASCKEKCSRKCEHATCGEPCGSECDIPMCSEACKKLQKCGHACRGLCGEVCPQICNVCKPDEFPDIFFGNEDEEDARFVKLIDCPHVIEVDGLDTWMQEKPDGEIFVPACPQCKTPIVNTPRYSNIVKQSQVKIEAVKKKIFGDLEQNKITLFNLENDVSLLLTNANAVILKVPLWIHQLQSLKKFVSSNMALAEGKQVMRLSALDLNKLTFTFDVLKKIMDVYCTLKNFDSEIVDLQMKIILNSIEQKGTKISEQQTCEMNNEISRLERIIDLLNLENSPEFKTNRSLLEKDVKKLKTQVIYSFESFDEKTSTTIGEQVNALRKKVAMTPLTAQERSIIVKAMGFTQGHWYMCSKGHPYCIADCGGAMEKSKCPECGEVIGGTQHTLVASNRVATFMDGARHGAWSDAANMANYQF